MHFEQRKGDTNQNATVDNRAASYSHVRDINNISVNAHHQETSGIVYYPPKRDVALIEKLSKLIFDQLSERAARSTQLAAWGIGGLLSLGGILSAVKSGSPAMPFTAASWLFMTGIAVIGVGIALHNAITYRSETRCEKCRAFYSMRESAEPVGREFRLSDGATRAIDRTFTCELCGHEDQRREHTRAPDRD